MSFSHQCWLLVFHWSLSDKSPQLFRTLFYIRVDLNNAVVWMVSVYSLISNFSNPLTKALRTIPSSLIITAITITFMFHYIFSSLAKSKYLLLISFSVIFTLWSAMTTKSTKQQVRFPSLIVIRSGLLAVIR